MVSNEGNKAKLFSELRFTFQIWEYQLGSARLGFKDSGTDEVLVLGPCRT